jgi:predicted MFS family arabinose efflux permease
LVGRHLLSLLCGLPMALAAVTIGLLALGHSLWGVAAMMVVWGTLNSAIPVAWSTWLSKGIRDEPESGGGLMVATIQLAIMLGAGLGDCCSTIFRLWQRSLEALFCWRSHRLP